MPIAYAINNITLTLKNPLSYSGGENIKFNGQDYLVLIDGDTYNYSIENYNLSTFTYTYNSKTYDMQHVITTIVTSFSQLFYNKILFNEDISSWDTCNIINMYNMFRNAEAFNKDIRPWNTSNVTNMEHIFDGAINFNYDLRLWNTSNVNNYLNAFNNATLMINNYNAPNTPDVSYFNKLINSDTDEYYNINLLLNKGHYIIYNDNETNMNYDDNTKFSTKKISITQNSLISGIRTTQKDTKHGDYKTLGIIKVIALDSNNNELSISGITNKQDKIYIEIENNNLDITKNYFIYKYSDSTKEILESQGPDYPITTNFKTDTTNTTVFGYLSGLTTIGLVQEGNVPCPCFHKDTKILCFNPETKEEYYQKVKNIKENETYLKIFNNSENYMKVLKHEIIYNKKENKSNNELFYNHKEYNDIIMLGGHNIYDKQNKKIKVCECDDYELLKINKEIQEIHLIKLDEDEKYDIYLKYDIKTESC